MLNWKGPYYEIFLIGTYGLLHICMVFLEKHNICKTYRDVGLGLTNTELRCCFKQLHCHAVYMPNAGESRRKTLRNVFAAQIVIRRYYDVLHIGTRLGFSKQCKLFPERNHVHSKLKL